MSKQILNVLETASIKTFLVEAVFLIFKINVVILLWLPFNLISQTIEQNQIEGKIYNENTPIQDAIILNSSTEEFSTSDANGLFRVKGSLGDTLMFSHLSFESFSEIVTDEILNLKMVTIQVSDKINKLDEVTVNAFPKINAFSLRIIDHEIEELTTNERRLKTAGDFKPIHLLSILGGSLAIDPIINKISGRTDKLKQLITFDQEEDYFNYIIDTQAEYIKTKLKIPEDELNRFVYFLVDKAEIKEAKTIENIAQLQFFMQDLALQFITD